MYATLILLVLSSMVSLPSHSWSRHWLAVSLEAGLRLSSREMRSLAAADTWSNSARSKLYLHLDIRK